MKLFFCHDWTFLVKPDSPAAARGGTLFAIRGRPAYHVAMNAPFLSLCPRRGAADGAPALLRCGCKINLALRITGRRPDGRHDLDTLFFPLPEPHDELVIRVVPGQEGGKNGGAGLVLRCEAADIDPVDNTLTKAHALFAARSGFAPGLRVDLRKGVPSGAGLGGGSADAAALLLWLNERASAAGAALSAPALAGVAAQVGADVPFFLRGVPCRGTGIGDVLTPCDPVGELGLRGFGLVLVCPGVHVSTARAYAAFDARQARETDRCALTAGPETAKEPLSPPSAGKDRSEGPFWFENAFEAPVFEAWPQLRLLKERLLRDGAGAVVMSGSGAAMFALYRRADDARVMAGRLRGAGVAAYSHVL